MAEMKEGKAVPFQISLASARVNAEMTQEEVDALVSELQNAINALEKAPTVTTDTNEPAHKPQVVTNNKVKTGDSTSVWTFATFALMAAIVYVSLRKRTKED